MSTTRNGPARGRPAPGWHRRTTAAPPRRRVRPRARPRSRPAPRRRTRPGCPRRGRPTSPRTAPARRRVRGCARRSRRRPRTCAPAPRAPGAGPVDALAEPDDLHPPVHVDQGAGRRVDVGDQQPDRVGAAVDRGHAVTVMRSSRHGGSARRMVQPPTRSGSSASASSPSGLTPGPAASECATRTCRHLTRSGIPPADTPAISGTTAERLPRGDVRLVRGAVGRGQLGVGGQPLAHRTHQALGLEGADRARSPAGRSGSRASGRACRRAAAAPSRPRRGCRTGSGARRRAPRGGSRPSWPATAGGRGVAATAQGLPAGGRGRRPPRRLPTTRRTTPAPAAASWAASARGWAGRGARRSKATSPGIT